MNKDIHISSSKNVYRGIKTSRYYTFISVSVETVVVSAGVYVCTLASALDCSSYDFVEIEVYCMHTTLAQLQHYVMTECYYG